jgi:hypothetical protein
LEFWLVTIFLPAVLLRLAMMVLITRWRDGRNTAADPQRAWSASSAQLVEVLGDVASLDDRP